MKIFYLISLVALVAVGCGNPSDANKTNFQNAINAYFEKSPACIHIFGAREMPETIKVTPLRQQTISAYDNFVRLGLLQVTESETQEVGVLGYHKIKTRKYELTEEGKQYYSLGTIKNVGAMFGGAGTFCYGKRTVSEIKNFSEPANMMGMTISNVNFSYKITEVAPWANDANIRETYKDIEKTITGKNEGKATLVKTNEGWIHEALFRQ